jgi:peroxiredoxin 2/4
MKKGLLMSFLFIFPLVQSWTQRGNEAAPGIPLIGVEAPSFSALSTKGQINFPADFGRDWKVLFAHPKAFTPVCSSELLEMAHAQEVFDRLGARLIVVSTDNLDQQMSWKSALEEVRFKGNNPVKIGFPLVEDPQLRISNQYGMIHPSVSIGENIRGVFIIDPDNKVRAIFYYPNEVGRNIDELARTLVALQTTRSNPRIVTPANWRAGDDYMVPVLTSSERENVGKQGSAHYQFHWFMIYQKP